MIPQYDSRLRDTPREKFNLPPLDPKLGERTLLIVKPNAFEHRDEIAQRVRSAELSIAHSQILYLTKEIAEDLYREHARQTWYSELIDFMTMGPVVIMAIEGQNAVARVTEIVGNVGQAGTIRGDYSDPQDANKNAAHRSAKIEDASRELGIFYVTV